MPRCRSGTVVDEMRARQRKLLGQYATPPELVAGLMGWLVRQPTDTFLDPSCGDGRFLAAHSRSTGIELCSERSAEARRAAPHAAVYETEFFEWAEGTPQRFDAVGGNPPFIRYQHFTGATRQRAARLSSAMRAEFSGLASSWAPFVVVSASLLRPGGRLAFVVPAEIGHATYAVPLIRSLCEHFASVRLIAIRDKVFPELSEDAWLLYAADYGGRTEHVHLTIWDRFRAVKRPPPADRVVSLADYLDGAPRLRKYILPEGVVRLYDRLSQARGVVRLGDLADVGIGYVTGANDFFHLSPSQVRFLRIDRHFTRVAVRKGDQLPADMVDHRVVAEWLRQDLPVLLLDLSGTAGVPAPIQHYLDSPQAQGVKQRYKCRVRDPWYVVPGVTVPDGFLSYMSGMEPALVWNAASCVCTNSVHAVHLRDSLPFHLLQKAWQHPLSRLSQEIEGHPLGGGMLKLEPREAGRVLVPLELREWSQSDIDIVLEGVQVARHWRHVA